MPKISLGVDIGLRYIKLVYTVGTFDTKNNNGKKGNTRGTNGTGDKVKILRYSTIETPKDCFSDDEVYNPAAISQLINDDIKTSGLSPVQLSLCTNKKAATIREIRLSKIKKEELSSAIAFELSQIYPGIMGTSTVTYKIYSMQNGEMNGLSAFCQNKVLSSYFQIANSLDVKLKNIDVSSNAIVKAISYFSPSVIKDKTVLLVDIGEHTSNISFVLNERLLLSRVVNAGLSNIYQIMADSLNITITQADEAYKRNTLKALGVSEKDMQSYMRLGYLSIEQQINQTLEYCRYTYPNNLINDIILLGGGSQLSGLPEYLSDTFNIPASCIISDWLNDQISPEAFMIFLPALGSLIFEEKKDLSDINFVQATQRARIKPKKPVVLIITFSVFILLSLGLGVNYIIMDIAQNKLLLEETDLNNKIASYSELTTVKKELSDSEERVSVLSTIEEISIATGLQTSNFLNVLAKMLPDEIFAISVSVSGDKTLSLNGKSSTREAIAYFVNNLIENELFTEVQLSSVVSTSMQNDTAVDYNFVISLKVIK
jgi:type IV pilus assembly protein PilM